MTDADDEWILFDDKEPAQQKYIMALFKNPVGTGLSEEILKYNSWEQTYCAEHSTEPKNIVYWLPLFPSHPKELPEENEGESE